MNPAFRTFSYRVLPLHYDALASLIGEQDLAPASKQFGLQPFVKVSFTEHSLSPTSPFNANPLIGKCEGPQTSPGARPFLRDWYAWQATAGIRVQKDVAPTLPGDSLGQASQLFPAIKTDFVSIAFNNLGLMAVAIDAGQNTIAIRRFIDSSGNQQAATPFLGKTPLLFFLGNLFVEETVSLAEIVCLYVHADSGSNSIYCRFEHDNFATEYVINANTPVLFGSLISVFADSSNRMQLLATDLNDRDVVFTSNPYAVLTDPTKGRETNSYLLNSISYIATAVPVSANFDKSKMQSSLSSIAYIDTIVQPVGSGTVLQDSSGVAAALNLLEYL